MAIIKVITPSVTDANITAAKVTDNAITLAKMASGTDGNIISYDASGNPVAVATGNDGQVLTSTGAGSPPVFETPASAANTPTFRAYRNSSLNVDSNSATKIVFDAETFDPQSTFASGKFTPGVSGKYFLRSSIRLAPSVYNQIGVIIYKNGSGIAYQWRNTDSSSGNPSGTVSSIVESDTNDYFEIYLYHLKGSAAEITTGTYATWFEGFKIIE